LYAVGINDLTTRQQVGTLVGVKDSIAGLNNSIAAAVGLDASCKQLRQQLVLNGKKTTLEALSSDAGLKNSSE